MRIYTKLRRHCGRGSDNNPELDLEIAGSGSIDDPFLITNIKNWDNGDYELTLSDTKKKFINLNNINLRAIYLKNSENISISDAYVINLGLDNCSNISIRTTNIEKKLELSNVKQINILNCKIKKLFAFSGEEVLISDSSIMKISKKSEATILVQED